MTMHPAPAHADPAPRRPRAWHLAGALTVGAWAAGLVLGSGTTCTSAPAPAPRTTTVAAPTTTSPAPSSITARAGVTEADMRRVLNACRLQYPGGGDDARWKRIACAESAGVLGAADTARLSAHEAEVRRIERAKPAPQPAAATSKCKSSTGSDLATWVMWGAMCWLSVAGWRRGKEYLGHKSDCAVAEKFARTYPHGEDWRAQTGELAEVHAAASRAAHEAFSQRGYWFGGDADEDTARADGYLDIADRAGYQLSLRQPVSAAQMLADDASNSITPDLPTGPDAPDTYTPQPTTDWASKLQGDNDD